MYGRNIVIVERVDHVAVKLHFIPDPVYTEHVSLSAFERYDKERWVNGNIAFKSYNEELYHEDRKRFEEVMNRTVQRFAASGRVFEPYKEPALIDVPHKSLWDFYIHIGYDYKTKTF